MTNISIPLATPVSISSLGLNEAWLQEQIFSNPSCLGLGELEGVSRERVTSSGGRLDILLKDPVDDTMYEVEVMLGETDPSHIIRTIEYWDLTKRKWPQRQHYAVLVAEKITHRFFNVIQLLSGSIPLIAIQASIIKHAGGHLLHFTKIVDVFEEVEDDSGGDSETYDEAYWKRKSPETLQVAQGVMAITSEIYSGAKLVYNKYSVNIVCQGNNVLLVRSRLGGNVLIELRYGGKRDQIAQLLDSRSIQFADKHRLFSFTLKTERVTEDPQLFREIAVLNKHWWDSTDQQD